MNDLFDKNVVVIPRSIVEQLLGELDSLIFKIKVDVVLPWVDGKTKELLIDDLNKKQTLFNALNLILSDQDEIEISINSTVQEISHNAHTNAQE